MSDTLQRMSKEEDWKRELGHVLFARRSLILPTALLIILGAIIIALYWPTTYAATSTLLVLGKRSQVSASALDPVELRNPQVSSQDIISEVEILRSPELIRHVILKIRGIEESAATPPSPELIKAARNVLSRLEVTGVTDSNAIRLRFSADSPDKAELGLEALLDSYIIYRARVFNPIGQDAYLKERMQHYRDQLDALIAKVEGEGGEVSPEFIDQIMTGNSDRLAAMQQRLARLELDMAVTTYKENEPLQKQITIVQKAINDLQAENRVMQSKRLAAESVQREAELITHSLDTFAKRAEEAHINDSIARNQLAGDVSILNRATGTAELVFPKPGLTILIGIIVAVITSVSAGFLVEFFDHTVRRPEDIETHTGLPVICSLPVLDELAAAPVLPPKPSA
jgi:uncharacterized protein involved in exopolysaccharide biosynthesis